VTFWGALGWWQTSPTTPAAQAQSPASEEVDAVSPHASGWSHEYTRQQARNSKQKYQHPTHMHQPQACSKQLLRTTTTTPARHVMQGLFSAAGSLAAPLLKPDSHHLVPLAKKSASIATLVVATKNWHFASYATKH
jgi:hypothetical protein